MKHIDSIVKYWGTRRVEKNIKTFAILVTLRFNRNCRNCLKVQELFLSSQ